MKRRLRVPIRLRFMLTSLSVVSLVVGLITFATASLFQEDKQGYVNGLTSMVVQGTAEDARGILDGYREKVQLYGRLLLDSDAHADRGETLSRTVFDEFPELIAVSVLREGKSPLAVYNVTRLTGVGSARPISRAPIGRPRSRPPRSNRAACSCAAPRSRRSFPPSFWPSGFPPARTAGHRWCRPCCRRSVSRC